MWEQKKRTCYRTEIFQILETWTETCKIKNIPVSEPNTQNVLWIVLKKSTLTYIYCFN